MEATGLALQNDRSLILGALRRQGCRQCCAETRTCDGETIVVNLQGAMIATTFGLSTGMEISIHVYVTDKRAAARVVSVDPENPLHCGIEFAEPRNIVGAHLPPTDWDETDVLQFR